jgi:hypothetical protein
VGIEEVKSAIKALSVEERRKVALYILELEKDHVRDNIGPQIAGDLDAFSRIVQESVEKIKKVVNKKQPG